MPWLMPVAMVLSALAALYGIGAIGSLVLRATRLAFARKGKHALLCGAFVLVVVVSAVLFSHLVLRTRPVEWPFFPQDIPFYVAFIGLCHYLANVAPKRWQL